MSLVEPNKKTLYGGHKLPNIFCLECGEPMHDDHSKVIRGGSYHLGSSEIFLCTNCAAHSNLHVIGYLIGDALAAYYIPNQFPYNSFSSKVNIVIDRLKSSIFRAITHQLQWKLKNCKCEHIDPNE